MFAGVHGCRVSVDIREEAECDVLTPPDAPTVRRQSRCRSTSPQCLGSSPIANQLEVAALVADDVAATTKVMVRAVLQQQWPRLPK